MTQSTAPPLASSRRTRQKVGKSDPSASATMPSVRESCAAPTRHVVSSSVEPLRYRR
jgi:hypothetical protein